MFFQRKKTDKKDTNINLLHTLIHVCGVITLERRQLFEIASMYADKKSLETVFLIVICRQSGDKWQSKTLFLTIFDSTFVDSINVSDHTRLLSNFELTIDERRSKIARNSVFDCHLSPVW